MSSRSRATALAAAGMALAAGLALTGCSNANSGAPVSEANLSGSPVTASEDVSSLCKQILDEKLPVEAAQPLAEASGYTTRITSTDGAASPATTDLRDDRISFEVTAGIVTGCTIG